MHEPIPFRRPPAADDRTDDTLDRQRAQEEAQGEVAIDPVQTDDPPARERIAAIVRGQARDASFDEILRELAFERLVRRGLDDLAAGRTATTAQVNQAIRSWLR